MQNLNNRNIEQVKICDHMVIGKENATNLIKATRDRILEFEVKIREIQQMQVNQNVSNRN